MPIDITEKQFENTIVRTLLSGGYIKRETSRFDLDMLFDKELLIRFISSSQPEAWQNIQKIFGKDIDVEIICRLNSELEKRSMIDLLRNGFYIYEVHIDCAYFKPKSKRNPDAESLYDKNILSVIPQARYSKVNDNTVDLLLCLNGLPIATSEVKNPATGQKYEDAIRQYKLDRNPNEKLFHFKRRALVHFAVNPYESHLTTRIEGDKTTFIPFNKGRNEGRGNPDHPTSYRTSYLWESIWQKDIWLEIIARLYPPRKSSTNYIYSGKRTTNLSKISPI